MLCKCFMSHVAMVTCIKQPLEIIGNNCTVLQILMLGRLRRKIIATDS